MFRIDDSVHKKDHDQLSLQESTNNIDGVCTQESTIVQVK